MGDQVKLSSAVTTSTHKSSKFIEENFPCCYIVHTPFREIGISILQRQDVLSVCVPDPGVVSLLFGSDSHTICKQTSHFDVRGYEIFRDSLLPLQSCAGTCTQMLYSREVRVTLSTQGMSPRTAQPGGHDFSGVKPVQSMQTYRRVRIPGSELCYTPRKKYILRN